MSQKFGRLGDELPTREDRITARIRCRLQPCFMHVRAKGENGPWWRQLRLELMHHIGRVKACRGKVKHNDISFRLLKKLFGSQCDNALCADRDCGSSDP